MRYQSDKQLVPFLDANLSTLLRGPCRRFVNKIVMDSASSSALLVKVNMSDSASHVGNVKIDTGFSATKALKELAATKKCSDLARMRFRDNCKKALVAATDKLLVKSPLKYVMTRNLACLDPQMMASDSHGCVSSFRRVLHKLADLHQVNEADCDLIGWQFAAFMDEVATWHTWNLRNKQTSIDSDCNAKRKMEADERNKREAKKRRLDNDIAALMKSSDELADSAETTGDLSLLLQSNALRKNAATKRQALKDL